MSLPTPIQAPGNNQSIYHFNHYKEYLRYLLDSNRGLRGYQATLARAAGCKPSYFSGVIRSTLDLTPDQIMGIAMFLSLSNKATEYFLNILALGKTEFQPLRNHIESRLAELRAGEMARDFRLNPVEFSVATSSKQ